MLDKLLAKLGLLTFLILKISFGFSQDKETIRKFLAGLDTVRMNLKIPGMGYALARGDSILAQGGFGWADVQHHIPVNESTSFRVASITKTLTSTLIMQLVDQGRLDLETPVSRFGIDLGNPGITVKHLLTHTSELEPGTYYQYNGFRFGRLGLVVEAITGRPFYREMMENILVPAGMTSSAPGISHYADSASIQGNKEMLHYFDAAYHQLARPYEIDGSGEVVETKYLDEFGAFGGLITTPHDLIKYSRSIDRNRFVSANTQSKIFSPNRLKNGEMTPYGLGWFTQRYRGVDIYWHYGQTQGESGLFVKLPSKNLAIVVLTNSDKLSSPFPLGDGDLLTSPVGQLIYKYLINDDRSLKLVNYSAPIDQVKKQLTAAQLNPYREFYKKELVAQASMNMIRGDTARTRELYSLYAEINSFREMDFSNFKPIVKIDKVGINREDSISFSLGKPTRLRVHGVGENCSGDFSSWCDYGWITNASGKIIWQMQGHKAQPAGGAKKNQMVDMFINLPPGSYKLHYKSDSGHAFGNWDSLPPKDFFWGIVLLQQ